MYLFIWNKFYSCHADEKFYERNLSVCFIYRFALFFGHVWNISHIPHMRLYIFPGVHIPEGQYCCLKRRIEGTKICFLRSVVGVKLQYKLILGRNYVLIIQNYHVVT
jgi:hypothetical protein